ncbi:unnamed protein product, partial [Tuber aestivum]
AAVTTCTSTTGSTYSTLSTVHPTFFLGSARGDIARVTQAHTDASEATVPHRTTVSSPASTITSLHHQSQNSVASQRPGEKNKKRFQKERKPKKPSKKEQMGKWNRTYHAEPHAIFLGGWVSYSLVHGYF